MFLSDEKIIELEKKANDIRESIIEMLLEAGSGHTAGPLGMADIFTLFYFHILKHDPKIQLGRSGIGWCSQMGIFARSCMPRWRMPDISQLKN